LKTKAKANCYNCQLRYVVEDQDRDDDNE